MTTQAEIIADIERRAAALAIPMYQVCSAAGIAPSTFYRWKDGAGATFTKIDAITAELGRREAASA